MIIKKIFNAKNINIAAIAKKIAKKKSVKAVYLFGSYASGRTHKFSDIDLCIVSDGKENAEYPVSDKLDVSYFHRLPLIIQFRVLKEGKPLIVKDLNFIHKLKIITLRRYVEFKRTIDNFARETLKCTI